MKKLFKSLLMSALVLTAGAFVACTDNGGDDNGKFEGMPEISAVADVDGVTLEGGVVTVTVTSNAPWTAVADAADVTLSKTKGNGDATVTVTVPASTAAREIKVTFTAVGYMMSQELTVDAEVLLTQNATGAPMISSVTPETVGSGAEFSFEGVTVVATGSQAYVIADESGAMMVYHSGHGRTVGEKINISGQVTVYKDEAKGSFGTPQFSSAATVEVVSTGNEVAHNPVAVSGADFDALTNNKIAKEVELVGTWTVSGNFVNITDIEGASKQGSVKYINNADYAQFEGQTVVIKGYYVGLSVSGSNNYVNVMPYSVEADPNSPQLSVNKTEIFFNADGISPNTGSNRETFTVTTNGLSGYELTWAIDNDTDFAFGKQLGNPAKPSFYVDTKGANEGAAKVANILITYSNGEKTLTKSVKVVQAGTTATTYTKIDRAANLTAGTYYMAAYLEKNSDGVDLAPYNYQLFNGSGASSKDLATVSYKFENGELTLKEGESSEAVVVTLEDAGNGQFYVKNSKDGMYLKSTAASNRKLTLDAAPYAWTAKDNANGGITLSDGSVNVGSANAKSAFIRSYTDESTLKFGLYFFKQN